MMLQPNQIKIYVASVCEKESAIIAAYLFGSYAKGRQKQSSDLDIALLLKENETGSFSLLSFITALEKQTGYKVDAVILNDAGEVLKHEIRRDGILVFERSSKYRKNFEVRGRKSYEDFLHLHKNYVKRILYEGRNG
ncbi:MAG: nucleotidyltransferase domain-containing protein [Desulfosarcina sp.]|nr:nucleotidyltransferase domain-containing protein [Desulfobacterales bacterium]